MREMLQIRNQRFGRWLSVYRFDDLMNHEFGRCPCHEHIFFALVIVSGDLWQMEQFFAKKKKTNAQAVERGRVNISVTAG